MLNCNLILRENNPQNIGLNSGSIFLWLYELWQVTEFPFVPYLTMVAPLPEAIVKLTQVKTQEALIKSGPRHIINT